MTAAVLPVEDGSRLWLAVLGAAILAGAWLRLQQIGAQVLIDDEWHAVHQVIIHTPRDMFVDFGNADYSIPLGLLDWYEARAFGLSELTLRWPMLLCGLATLVAFPLYVMRAVGRPTAAVFAVLLAMSPLLVVYSRMARPYAITLLLGWIAIAAFNRYHLDATATPARWMAGTTYAVTAALATWLHPVIAPFVFAPLLWGLLALANAGPGARRVAFQRWLALAVATGALTAAVVLPPLLAHPRALADKGGGDGPNLATLIGAWYAWFGTPSTPVLIMALVLAACGTSYVWRKLPVVRTGTFGILLTMFVVVASRPVWSQLPITVSRYLLPAVPLLLLAVAAGMIRIAELLAQPETTLRRALALSVLVLPIALFAAQSPLVPLLRRPNTETQHLINYIDFRADHNPYLPQFAAVPLSPFWTGLATRPAGSLRIAAAPFYFESYNWDAPRWERLSLQSVIPGDLTGLCVARRAGEVPQDPRYHFDNAVHLADLTELAAKRIDYIAWQKPFTLTVDGHSQRIGDDTAPCEAVLRARFGPAEYEDPQIIVFRVAGSAPSPPSAPQ